MTDYILITGVAGAIGSNMVRLLTESKKHIIVLDNLSSGYRRNIEKAKNVKFVKGDITKDSDLKKVFSYNIATIFHLAAHFANQDSIDHPEKDLLTNALSTLKLLEYSVKKKI